MYGGIQPQKFALAIRIILAKTVNTNAAMTKRVMGKVFVELMENVYAMRAVLANFVNTLALIKRHAQVTAVAQSTTPEKKAVCECDCNYFGEDCSMQNSTCVASGYCKHGSCCTDTDQCLCKPGGYGGVVYYGKQCDIEPTGCDESFCGGHGSCVFNKTGPFSVQCECTKPFFGPNCETCHRGNGMKCDCDSGCSGHGFCGSDGQCDCACNYFGNFCQFHDEKCVEAHYCDNGGCCTGTNYCDCPGDDLFGKPVIHFLIIVLKLYVATEEDA